MNLDLKSKTNMELANMINGLEGFIWRLNHDAADGRIEHDVDSDTSEMRKNVELIAAEIQTRTGIEDQQKLIEYIRGQIKEQERLWDETWASIYKEGAVFQIPPGRRRYSEKQTPLETIRTYLPAKGCMGPKQYIVARMHGREGLMRFDDRDVVALETVDIEPQYSKGDYWTRGLIKADEAMEQREKYTSEKDDINWQKWTRFRGDTDEFTHAGFETTLQVYGTYNFADKDRCEENGVVLAITKLRKMYIEFTPKDLPGIVITKTAYKDLHADCNF